MQQRGFTLLEIIIAMAIFTMLGLAATGVLNTVTTADQRSSDHVTQLQTLQRVMLIIERDMEQVVARPVRSYDYEDNNLVMVGGDLDDSDADGIIFVRTGWENPQLMLPRSTLQFVSYRLRDNKLERLYGNYVDNVIGFEPKVRTLLEDVDDLQVEFFTARDENNSDQLEWNDSYSGESLPKGVAIEITTAAFGKVRREFALLGASQ